MTPNPLGVVGPLPIIIPSVAMPGSPENQAWTDAVSGAISGWGSSSDAWDGSPRPGSIPGTTESHGPIEIDPLRQCPPENPDPSDCGRMYTRTLNSCLATGGNHRQCVIRAAGAALLCVIGNIGRGGDGGNSGNGPTIPPGIYPR